MDIDTVNDLANASNLITPFNTRELAPAATTTMPNSSPYQQPTTFSNPDAASDVIMGFVDAFIPKDKLAWFKRLVFVSRRDGRFSCSQPSPDLNMLTFISGHQNHESKTKNNKI